MMMVLTSGGGAEGSGGAVGRSNLKLMRCLVGRVENVMHSWDLVWVRRDQCLILEVRLCLIGGLDDGADVDQRRGWGPG